MALIVAAVAFFILYFALHVHVFFSAAVPNEASHSHYAELQSAIALMTVIVALGGLVLSSTSNAKHARSQHTIHVLNTRFSESRHYDAIYCIQKHVPAGIGVTMLQLRQAQKRIQPATEVISNLRSLGNWYEFLASAMRRGELDEALVFEALGSNILQFYALGWRFIHTARGALAEDLEVTTPAQKPEVYKNLLWILCRWGVSSVLEGGMSFEMTPRMPPNDFNVIVAAILLAGTAVIVFGSKFLTMH